MEFPVEILDRIFSALKSNPLSLYNCSNACPMFSHIVERYIYYHIIIPSRLTQSDCRSGYRLGSSHIVKLLSEAPHIVDYVRILEFSFEGRLSHLQEIAPILSKFHALQCIILPVSHYMSWQRLEFQCFKTAVDFGLPALQEVHVGDMAFPLSILNGHSNITRLALSRCNGSLDGTDSPFPQLESLFADGCYWNCLKKWGKHHFAKLQSLTHGYSTEDFSKFVGICSDSLEDLDVNMCSTSPCQFPFHF